MAGRKGFSGEGFSEEAPEQWKLTGEPGAKGLSR